jgi:hypothetical protein
MSFGSNFVWRGNDNANRPQHHYNPSPGVVKAIPC